MNYSPPIEERQVVNDPQAWQQSTTRDWAFVEFGVIVALVIGGIGVVVFAAEMILR
jgi:hypothetical protein